MFYKYLSIALIGLLAFGANTTISFAQTKTDNKASNVEKVKANVVKRGINEKKSVRVKMLNGTKLKGYIAQIGDDSFTLNDSQTKQPITIAYRDAERVDGGGLGGAKIAIIAGAAAGVTLLVLYIAFLNATRDN